MSVGRKVEKMDYRNKAVNCVKVTILPIHQNQFEECGCILDEQYKKYGNTGNHRKPSIFLLKYIAGYLKMIVG